MRVRVRVTRVKPWPLLRRFLWECWPRLLALVLSLGLFLLRAAQSRLAGHDDE